MDGLAGLWPFILMIPIFYFLIYRPQAKKQKKQSSFLDNLTKGDEIVTTSGIIGKVNKVEATTVKIQVDTKTYLTLSKGSISQEMTEKHLKSGEE